MKITAGPANVINARAPKFAIRWKSMPMAMKRSHKTDFSTGYGASAHRSPRRSSLCDGLSQLP